MSAPAILPRDLPGLGKTLAHRLANPDAAARAERIVVEHAPDERLALAFLLELARHSRDSLIDALTHQDLAADLIFCLGSSELVAGELAGTGAAWPVIFARAREENAESLAATMHCDPIDGSRAEVAAALGDWKPRRFFEIAVADLLGLTSVSATAALMSALAEECIRTAYAAANRLLGDRAAEIGAFCVLAM